MGEIKRFKFIQDSLVKADVFDNDEFVCCTLSVWVEQLVDLLNQLNDENDVLKQQLKTKYIVNKQYEEKVRLEKEKEQLKSTLAFRSNQLALMESLIDDLGSEEMKRQMREILND